MDTAPERAVPASLAIVETDAVAGPAAVVTTASGLRVPAPGGRGRLAAELRRSSGAIAIYLASRALLLVLAVVNGVLQHTPTTIELTNWDGFWYLKLAADGYPTVVSHSQSVLGFFPLYPMGIWLLAHVLFCSDTVAGLLISGVGGLVATVLIERLCAQWWGPAGARRAVIFFCVFPGSVVFSMVYSEGVLIPLAVGCLLAMRSGRWLLAGILAAFATAVGPDALAIIPACAVGAGLEIRARGWHDRGARRSLVAPVLAPVGIVAFGVYLWLRTGTPFASFDAQHYGWGERTDALALVHQAETLADEISFTHFNYHLVNLNIVAGLLGAVVLVIGAVLLVRRPRVVSPTAIAWAYGIGLFAVTSEYTPPNPRLLITAFPALLAIANALATRGFRILVAVSTALLIAMTAVTYVGIALRP